MSLVIFSLDLIAKTGRTGIYQLRNAFPGVMMNQDVFKLVEGKFERLYQRLQSLETSEQLPDQLLTEVRSFYNDLQRVSQELSEDLHTLFSSLGLIEAPSDLPQVPEETGQKASLQNIREIQDMFEYAPVGMALFDADPPYKVLAYNHIYQSYWPKPYDTQGLIGEFATDFFPQETQDNIFEIFEEVRRTGQPKTVRSFEIHRAKQETTWWNMCLAPVFVEGRLVAFSHMLVDVTEQVQSRRLLEMELAERERAEDELAKSNLTLAQSEARFQVALKHSPIMVYTTDRELRYTWIHNPRHGFEPEQILGKRDDEIFPPEDVGDLVEFKRQVLMSGQGQRQEIEFTYAGRPLTYDVTAEPVIDAGGQVTGLTVAAYDITDIKKLQAETLAHSAEIETHHLLSEQRERERMEIARYLHDDPVQDLLAVTYDLQSTLLDASEGSVASALKDVTRDVKRVIHKLRNFSYELRPPMLANFSLAKNLHAYAERFREQYPHTQIQLNLQKDGDLLNSRVRITLFRVYQETLNNVGRHAHAQKVMVNLRLDAEWVYLEVIDDGVGFDVPEQWLSIARQGHLGLVGIWERVDGLGGNFEIHSEPGQGTRVQIRVPYSAVGGQDEEGGRSESGFENSGDGP
jgi:PAS domain S-box-containing protein